MTSRSADGVTVDYGYNANGDLVSAEGPYGEIAIVRNRLGDPEEVTPDDGSAETTYGYGFTSGSREDVSGEYDFTFDAFGRETSVTAPVHPTNDFTFEWRPDGNLRTRGDPMGIDHDYSYTGGFVGEIESTGTSCSGSCADIDYTYNRAGMRLTEASSIDGDPANGTASFSYDAVGRLTGYDAPGSIDDQAYEWQKVLNRDSLTVGTTTVTTSFDAANRPTSDSASGTYSHDDDGNTLTMPGYQLAWDSLGRLTSVKDGSGNVLSTYTYDALDRLRDVTSSGTTIRHRYVGITTQLAQLRNVTTSTSVVKLGSSWDGVMLAEWVTTTSGRRYYGYNGHGDLTWTAGNGGSVNSTRRYDPWGGIVASSGTHPELRFQGSWRDPATGLYWVVARWYAPQLGTFLSEDELLGEPENPRSRHLYAYAWGDPVGKVDRDGKQTECNAIPAFGLLSAGAKIGCGALSWGLKVGGVVLAGVAGALGLNAVREAEQTSLVRRVLRRIEDSTRWCWVIGQIQARVDLFASFAVRCDTMPRLYRAFPSTLKKTLNAAWALNMMLQRKWLYDLGPCRVPPDFKSSKYYKMEQRLTKNYRRKTDWHWGHLMFGCR